MMQRPRVGETGAPGKKSASAILKSAALRLFSERGVDGVTVREIAELAGQSNHGAVTYHFGTKENLVRAIVEDGAKIINDRRNDILDRMEASGHRPTMREVVDVIIYPCVNVAGDGDDDCYLRFTQIMQLTHRKLFQSIVSNHFNSGYQRCLALIRELMPPMPPELASQRLVFLGLYITHALAARQTTLADKSREHTVWPNEGTLAHLSHTATAILLAPIEQG